MDGHPPRVYVATYASNRFVDVDRCRGAEAYNY